MSWQNPISGWSVKKTYQEDDYFHQMRALTRYYNELDHEITHLFNRLHAILQLSFPELERLFSTRSALFLNIVQLYPRPDEVLACSKTVIRNRLKANTKKNLSLVRAEQKGIALLEAAKDSYPAISKDDVRSEQVRDYSRRIADLKEKKVEALLFTRKPFPYSLGKFLIVIGFIPSSLATFNIECFLVLFSVLFLFY